MEEIHTIVAKGNNGDIPPNSYTYFLYLLVDPEHPDQLVKSAPLTVQNESSSANQSPWLHIIATPDAPPPEGQPQRFTLSFDPPDLLLNQGDVSLVKVSGLPKDHLVGVWFPFDRSETGPFPTSFVTRENGTGDIRLFGAQFDSAAVRKIPYCVRVWNADGTLVASPDPSVDGLGTPPG